MTLDEQATLVEALRDCYHALGLVDDFGTATGENPDIQNRALDQAETILATVDA